ncbi:MAG: cysteine desulfurase [Leptospiraceae bacterium]|nr:cysteine desulfurase [Leptospiraceae bacterium]
MIYFDYNATTPIHPAVKQKLPEWLDFYANPSAVHSAGRQARDMLEKARASILTNLDLEIYKLAFTSTGTEANFLALNFLFQDEPEEGTQVLLSSIEHPSIYNLKLLLVERGFIVKMIPVDKYGILDLEYLEDNCNEDTVLVAVMLANNETGVIQPLKEVREITDKYGVYLHCDAIQAPGKMKSIYSEIDADSYSFSSHKVYGMKGISAVAYRSKPVPVFRGGDQEKGVRPGTENLLGILSFDFALSEILGKEDTYLDLQLNNRNLLETKLKSLGGTILGEKAERLNNTTCITLPISNEKILIELDKRGIGVSRGSACHAGTWEPSHVLLAMGITKETANRTIRISSGIFTSQEDVENLISVLQDIIT